MHHVADYRPFPWDSLARVTLKETRLADRAARWVPGASEPRWSGAFEAFFADLVGTAFSVECLGFSTYEFGRFASPAGDVVVTEFELPPQRTAGVLAVDSHLAEWWLESLTGAPAVRLTTALEPRDRAVFTYLCMRSAEFLAGRGAPPATVSTREIAPSDAFARLGRSGPVVEADFLFSSAGRSGVARVYVPEPMCTVFDQWGRRAAAVGLPFAHIGLAAQVSIGNVGLPRGEVAALAPGDVVFPGSDPLSDCDGALLVGRAAISAGISLTDHAWSVILNPNETNEEVIVTEWTATPDEATSQLRDAVDVRVDFVVGNVELTVADLSRLQPGRAFVLERKVGEPIDIVVNGRPVAAGELVDVDGRIGVRVVRILSR